MMEIKPVTSCKDLLKRVDKKEPSILSNNLLIKKRKSKDAQKFYNTNKLLVLKAY